MKKLEQELKAIVRRATQEVVDGIGPIITDLVRQQLIGMGYQVAPPPPKPTPHTPQKVTDLAQALEIITHPKVRSTVKAAPPKDPLSAFRHRSVVPLWQVAKALGVMPGKLRLWAQRHECLYGVRSGTASIGMTDVRANLSQIMAECARQKSVRVPQQPKAMQTVLFESPDSAAAEAQVPGNLFYLPTNDNGSGTPPTELPH